MRRRGFLRAIAAGAGALALPPQWRRTGDGGHGSHAAAGQGALVSLSPHLEVLRGPVNGALLSDSERRLAVYGDPRADPSSAEVLLFTHHCRDVVWAGRPLADAGAEVVVPAAERDLFADVHAFWRFYAEHRFHDYVLPSTRVTDRPFDVAREVDDGATVEWGRHRIRAVATPGYTSGAVSYLVEVDGRRVAFTGDLIYGDGRILDVFSLQEGIEDLGVLGYHGYMGRAAQLLESLDRIAFEEPDVIVPARGSLIEEPLEAIGRLSRRLERVYRNFLSTTGLRWFGRDRTDALAERTLGTSDVQYLVDAEMRSSRPSWMKAVRTSRVLVAEDGSAFLVDCGTDAALEGVEELLERDEIRSVDGIYLTHYHDDHTHNASRAAERFACPVYACRQLAEILRRPRAFRMPAQTENPVEDVTPLAVDEVVEWKEFRLRSLYFPGQTLYHGALEVHRRGGQRFLLIGDAFTPTGLTDSCPHNRHWLHPDTGFFRCLDMLEEDPDVFLANQHVARPFRFSRSQIQRLRRAYRQRRDLLGELCAWDDPTFGSDPFWARFFPYETRMREDETARLVVKLKNHSARKRRFAIRPVAPPDWSVLEWQRESVLEPRAEGELRVEVAPNSTADPGPHLLTADVRVGEVELRRWAEAILWVG